MGDRLLKALLLTGIVSFSLLPTQVSADQERWWNTDWSYRQELSIPFDTHSNFSAYQPVDTTIIFSNPCWALNETWYSIRVICQFTTHDLELDSQIYDMNYLDTNHLASCSLVFLVPSGVDGTEQYYIYYNNVQTDPPKYTDHVSIKESSYFYEPIPGYSVQSHFYEILQNDTIVYSVHQDGTYLWYTTSQFVTKLIPAATEMNLKSGQTVASFEFAYYYGNEMWQYNSSSQQLVSKEILCDGNLMVSCKIVSQSTAKDVQTTAVYKYFYCPTPHTRIHAHVIHEALKECKVYPNTNTDGSYAGMQCGVMKSQSISELNFGTLYPFIHVSSKRNIVEEYRLDLNPEYNQENPVIRLLQTTDDVELGVKPWISFDEGLTGTVHAIIFGSSSVVKAGPDERDGIQVKAYESNYPHLPGLMYTIAGFQFTRNAFEKNTSTKDLAIPKGFLAEFDAEFFSSPSGGYPLVDHETSFFQRLLTIAPQSKFSGSQKENTTVDQHCVTVYVHNAHSFPLGSALSALTGHLFPYINVEIYLNNVMVRSGTAARVLLRQYTVVSNASLRQRISAALHILDLGNASLLKKINFQGLEDGRYVLKIYRQNARFSTNRQFIGYSVFDLTQNSTVHVWCRPQASLMISVTNQQNTGIPQVQIQLLSQGMIISENTTDAKGRGILTAPVSLRYPYTLRVLYQGFEVSNETLGLRLIHTIVPFKKSLELDQYIWGVQFVDLWGLPPGIPVRPRLTSKEMIIPTELFGTEGTNGTFSFAQLLPAHYMLQVSYKSFLVEQEITIPSQDESVVFPAVYPVSFRVLDSHGQGLNGVKIRIARDGRIMDTVYNGAVSTMSVPPGLYQVSVFSEDNVVVGQRSLDIVGTRYVDLITIQEPIFFWVIFLIGFFLILSGLAISALKKELTYVLVFLVIGFGVVSLVYPWWSLQGSSVDIQTSSKLFLFPLDLVSTTVTSQVIAGELSYFPTAFISLITIVLGSILGCWCFLGGSLLIRKKVRKRWFMAVLSVGLGLLIVSVVMFSVAMSAFTEVGVGSFFGQGTVDVLLQGQEGFTPVFCQWGPGIGFWLFVLSLVLLLVTFVFTMLKKRSKIG